MEPAAGQPEWYEIQPEIFDEPEDITFELGPFNDKDGNPITGAVMTLNINDTNYTSKSDNIGMIKFTILGKDVIGLLITVNGTFQHDDFYNGKLFNITSRFQLV